MEPLVLQPRVRPVPREPQRILLLLQPPWQAFQRIIRRNSSWKRAYSQAFLRLFPLAAQRVLPLERPLCASTGWEALRSVGVLPDGCFAMESRPVPGSEQFRRRDPQRMSHRCSVP